MTDLVRTSSSGLDPSTPRAPRPLKVGLAATHHRGHDGGRVGILARPGRLLAAGRIPRVRFALAARSSAVPVGRPGGLPDRHVGVLVRPLGPRRRDQHHHHRHLRVVHELPEPCAAREVSGHGRRDQRWASRPWPGRRVARARVPGLRVPIRSPSVPLRGGVHDHPVPDPGRPRRLRWAVLPGPRLRAPTMGSAPGSAAADDRQQRAAGATDRCSVRPGMELGLDVCARRDRPAPPARGRGVRRRRARPGNARADGRRRDRSAGP